jgi:TRAP transporter 4TM/12TM fusion protein
MARQSKATGPDLKELVADADTGGRAAGGFAGKLIFAVAVAWSLFQLWTASPLPFALGWGVLNDTETRSLHLGIGLLLAFLCFPAISTPSQRARIPWFDWALGLAAAFAGSYFLLFYAQLAARPGQPNLQDVVVATTGLFLLLEATRRAVGAPMTILAIAFLAYILLGRHLPDVLAHKGASWERMLSHQWLTTEGVFGVALGVSSGFIFIYVLFGAMLDRAGAGNYMMQVSFAMLGHLRGGPAKVSVVSSGLNGLISGSSVSNVVSGGIFTIPLMKKAGYGGVKAGAIETMSSVDGQIMPPVMGAAAFLMVEYVGIPYAEICKHAFLPAVLSYISLFYIVHLEAVKLGMKPMIRRRDRPLREKITAWGLGISGTIAVSCAIYFVAEAVKNLAGGAAPWILSVLLGALYVWTVFVASRCPDLPPDIDVDNPVQPQTWPTVKAGLHFLIPIGTLIWCLMIEEMSPALAAFWATMVLIVLMATHRPLTALFRKQRGALVELRRGLGDVLDGLNDGARSMIGIAIATGTAGIIVGGITLTGLGFRMTDFIEFVSFGNVLVMLLFTAFICLVLGLGVPTTANYILVATLMAPVIVELGAQSGLIIPLIGVHLFVFYYGIMGDITPPVGLATFAAAAISGEDPIQTGIQGSMYALRTVVLPFVWIFNPQLLLIDVNGWFELVLVVLASLCASLLFAAATMGWFHTKCRWWEIALLLLATFMLFRPNFFVDMLYAPYEDRPGKEIFTIANSLPDRDRIVLVMTGINVEGEDVKRTVAVQLGKPGDGRQRLAEAGLTFQVFGDEVRLAAVRFGSRAKKSGFEQGWKVSAIKVPTDRPSPHWVYIPALALAALVWFLQRSRVRPGRAQVA